MTDGLPAVLVIGQEPILHGMICRHLRPHCTVSGAPGSLAQALAAARGGTVQAMCVDADLDGASGGADAAMLVAKLRLVAGAPIVAVSAAASPGSAAAVALLQAGADVVLHKPAGRLPLDLGGAFGRRLLDFVLDVARAEVRPHA